MVSHGAGISQQYISLQDAAAVWRIFLVAQLLFYAGAACGFGAVIEFIAQVTETVRQPLLPLVRGATLAWGIASVATMATFLGIHASPSVHAGILVLETTGCLLQSATFVVAVAVIWPLQMSISRRLTVLTGFSPGFVVIAALIASMAVLPASNTTSDFTRSSNNFLIATQVSIMFLMINCTAAPLLQMGRRLGAGRAGPIIGYTGTRTCGSDGSGLQSRKHASVPDGYDMDTVTKGKLGPRNVLSSVVGGAYGGEKRLPKQHSRGVESRDVDGVSMESDNSQMIIIRKTVEQEV
ncbi:hypothetical protein LTR27_003999 [Elasticomyces elasticus]|nr:hypothetical protein LTR27_003999 [Elasticomyces elasticus]